MKALGRKRLRELWRLRAQLAAVALVAAIGVAMLVMSLATLHSLEASRDRYYREQRFADVFASLVRAPRAVAARLAALPGVAAVDARVTALGRGTLAGFVEPVQVQVVSLPREGTGLNRPRLRAGRLPSVDEPDALAISDAFAEAHGLRPGDHLTLTLRGHRRDFRIVGIAGAPDVVAQVSPQSLFPDPRRFAIAWLPLPALEAALDMRGAFNSVALRLQPGARLPATLAAVDAVLARHGGTGAIGRADQPSHRYLEDEFTQLRALARLFPAVFLGVSAFVLYVVLGRVIAGQREQIGTLKAFGYSNLDVGLHYAGHAVLVGLAGAALGVALGAWLGQAMAGLYRDFFRLPALAFAIPAPALLWAVGVSVGSALLGALVPVRQATRLPPAEAMRPETPTRGDARRLDRFAAFRRLRAPHRLVARNLLRRPLRTLLTCIGLSLGTAVVMLGRFHQDAVGQMVDRQFRQASREDLDVTFVEPLSRRALAEIASLPGVLRVEPQRAVPVQVRFRAASRRIALVGLAPGAQLRRPLDTRQRPIQARVSGVLLTDRLATSLGARPGDLLQFQTLDGRRRVLALPLAGLVGEPFGLQAYLPLEQLNRLLFEDDRVTGAVIGTTAADAPTLVTLLSERPQVLAVGQRAVAIHNFEDNMEGTILVFTLVATAFGVVITAGVVFSSARVALSERSRDLASLRVLGYTQAEVAYLLLGELALLTLLALPVGFGLGHALIAALVGSIDSDLFRVPHYVSAPTYGMAALVTVAAAALSAALVRRQVYRLDMIAVLKARD